jgi:hypothetical protein
MQFFIRQRGRLTDSLKLFVNKTGDYFFSAATDF